MNKKEKKKSKSKMILKIFIVLILCASCGVGTYFITYKIDKSKKGGDVKLTVTFDDTKTYKIPNVMKLDKDEALNEWPYIMHLNNKGTGKGIYQIIIKDVETSTIKREYLSYILYLSDKIVSEGKLKDLNNDILYTSYIDGKQEQEYSLYIWVSEELPLKESNEDGEEEKEEDINYEYSLVFNTIKDGGPGF